MVKSCEHTASMSDRVARRRAQTRERIFTEAMRLFAERGFEVPESQHPIVPVMIGDAVRAARMADQIVAAGVYVRAFSFPVVPRGKARIRTQVSAAHTRADLDLALDAFTAARATVG